MGCFSNCSTDDLRNAVMTMGKKTRAIMNPIGLPKGPLADDLLTAILLFIIPGVAANYVIGPTIAMVQTLSPVQMRAVSSAIMMLCLNLIGMGLGPLLVGVLSDLLTPQYGQDALSVALAFFTLVGLWGSVHFWLCGRALAKQQQDLE